MSSPAQSAAPGAGLPEGVSSSPGADVLERLAATLATRKGADPSSSYVASLHARGLDTILKKVGEEAAETIIAAKGGDRLQTLRETADLWFHCLVMLSHLDLGPGDVLGELARREGISGIDEKAARGRQRQP